MSYNIDNWKQIGGEPLRISKKNAKKLTRKFGDSAPEEWFIDGLMFGEDGYALVVRSLFRSGGSGNFYQEHLAEVVKCLEGDADFVISWEGGDTLSGLRISGGKATEMNIAIALVAIP